MAPLDVMLLLGSSVQFNDALTTNPVLELSANPQRSIKKQLSGVKDVLRYAVEIIQRCLR